MTEDLNGYFPMYISPIADTNQQFHYLHIILIQPAHGHRTNAQTDRTSPFTFLYLSNLYLIN